MTLIITISGTAKIKPRQFAFGSPTVATLSLQRNLPETMKRNFGLLGKASWNTSSHLTFRIQTTQFRSYHISLQNWIKCRNYVSCFNCNKLLLLQQIHWEFWLFLVWGNEPQMNGMCKVTLVTRVIFSRPGKQNGNPICPLFGAVNKPLQLTKRKSAGKFPFRLRLTLPPTFSLLQRITKPCGMDHANTVWSVRVSKHMLYWSWPRI